MMAIAAILVCAGCGPKRAPLAMLKEADEAFAARDYGRAAWLYHELKTAYPDSVTVRISLGFTYLKLGWLPYAGGEFSRALELSGRRNALAWLGLGMYYMRSDDWKLAMFCYGHARALDTQNPLVYMKLGMAYYQSREYANAAMNFTHAASLGNKSDALYALIGSCYERAAQWPLAVENYERAFAANKQNAEAARRLAVLYRDRFSNMRKAREYFQAFAKLDPERAKAVAETFEPRSGPLISNPVPFVAVAEPAETQQAAEAAAPAPAPPLSPAEKQARELADYYMRLGSRSVSNELPKDALRYFKQAVEKDPSRAYLNKEIAKIYEREFHDLNMAITYYEKYLEACRNNDEEFQASVAYVKKLREEYERIEGAERKRRLEEEERKRREEDERKHAEDERRRQAEARAAEEPETYDAAINRGAAMIASSQLEEARRYFQKAITINQAYPNAYYNLGLVYVMQTNFTDAIAYFQQALEKNPNYAESHLALGTVYDRLQQREAALEHFTTYLELAPNTSYADLVREWITRNAGAR